MAKGNPIIELRQARAARGLSLRQAGELIVVNGTPTGKGTWSAWESGKSVPSEDAMFELERVFNVEPNAFYRRPSAGDRAAAPCEAQGAMALAG